MKINWTKPDTATLSAYLQSYINLVPDGDLTQVLEQNAKNTSQLIASLSAEKLKFRYAEGKWSIPQILVHMIDTERIFSYRILCIARGEKAPLPGYEENDYAAASNADERVFSDIVEEFFYVRRSTLSLLRSLNAKQLSNIGNSNGKDVSVLVLCYVLAGHEIHHVNVIKEKYLK